MLFQRSKIAALLERLAVEHGIYLGTMSWKYPGWCGMLYDEDRYLWRNHFSKTRFNRSCLEEYAEVFKSVCVDATYYTFPKVEYLELLSAQVPDDFRFSFKVPDDITIKNFPKLDAFGKRKGKRNEYFLGVGTFKFGFLRHLEKIRSKVGMIIFEFSHFHANDFEHGRDFVAALDTFFAQIPKDWQYGVEVRNRNLLHPEYFQMLSHHKVAHIYNHWARMPAVPNQIDLHPLEDNPFVGARYLLTPQRSMDWANREFAPYNQLKEIDPAARESLCCMLDYLMGNNAHPDCPSYLYVSNQLEGNALHTISDVLEEALASAGNPDDARRTART